MIARTTGEVELPSNGVRISPSLTREEFLASALARASRELVRNEPYCTFALPPAQFDAHQFAWSLSFHGSRLESVTIACADPEFGSSWADWSEERELARKRFHDVLLQSVLGPDWNRHPFSWGRVDSVFDQKSGASSIVLRYDHPSLAQLVSFRRSSQI
jgi:hypothetical protein